MYELENVFAELHALACDRLGDEFYVDLRLGDPEEFPARRNMAYTLKDRRGDLCVVVAPKLVMVDNLPRVEGVLRHEFGHAALWYLGSMNHSERDADHMGEQLFGDRICYDAEDVQTILPGKYPRPNHLPK